MDINQEKYHTSVLLNESIELLRVKKGGKYIDSTLGGGGHAFEILKNGGQVLGLDMDQDALEYVGESIKFQNISRAISDDDLILVKSNFKDIKKIANNKGFKKVDGIIFDLGVSSHQLESAWKGFSFSRDGPLDMRMDRNLEVQAKDLINILTKGELYELFTNLGEERFARSIADSIVRARRIKPIYSTKELSGIINKSLPYEKTKSDVNARIFQSLRIAINDELNNLKYALPRAYDLLSENGRLVVISFHSLEDRIVKRKFLDWKKEGKGEILTKKPVIPGLAEVKKNKRSRSAKLRAFQKK